MGLIQFLPLEENTACWRDAILNASITEDRAGYADKMLAAGYDIGHQAQKLGEFYLQRYSDRK